MSPGLRSFFSSHLAHLRHTLREAAGSDAPLPKVILDALGLETFTITDDGGDPYLTRHYLTPHADWWRAPFKNADPWGLTLSESVLKLGLPGVYPHWFHRGDNDRELHCHPWEWSASLILWGGYREQRITGVELFGMRYEDADVDWRPVSTEHAAHRSLSPTAPKPIITTREYRPGSVNVLRAHTFHRVELLDPRGCLTLFVAGPRVGLPKESSWGFLSYDGRVYETIGERERRMAHLRQEKELGTT